MLDTNSNPAVIETISDLIGYILLAKQGAIKGVALKGVANKDMAAALDHDGAFADRDKLDNAKTPLKCWQRANAKTHAKNTGFLAVVTSRDNPLMVQYYHTDHVEKDGPMPSNFLIAGSGGYKILQDLTSDVTVNLPVLNKNGESYDPVEVEKAVSALHRVTDQLQKKYGKSLAESNPREMMSATLCGTFPSDELFKQFQEDARKFLEEAQKTVSIELKMDPGLNAEKRTGYIDFKIAAATKLVAVEEFLDNIEQFGLKLPKFITVVGDTPPDEKIVEAARNKIGKENVLAFCVDKHVTDFSKGVWNAALRPKEGSGYTGVEMFHMALWLLRLDEDALKMLQKAPELPTPVRPCKVLVPVNSKTADCGC